jgi:hypothetical protein
MLAETKLRRDGPALVTDISPPLMRALAPGGRHLARSISPATPRRSAKAVRTGGNKIYSPDLGPVGRRLDSRSWLYPRLALGVITFRGVSAIALTRIVLAVLAFSGLPLVI